MKYDYSETMKLDNQLCFPLYAAARNVTGLYTPHLRPLGLTYTQYITLLVLWEKDSISVSEIGNRLMLDNGTLSPMLKKMEQAGYIVRERSKDDDRVVIISLTQKGRDLKEEAKEMVKNLLEGLSIKDLNIDEKKLDKIDIKTGNLESRIYDKERECER